MRGIVVRAIPNLVVFLSGLAIMVLELVASRLVAKHLGSSLETWTTVIGVILAGMSLGNYWGGRLSDLREPLETLPYLLCGSAVLCLSVLLTNDLIGGSTLMAALPRSVRVVSTIMLVFFPPACLLGTIQPTVARWAIQQSEHAGTAFGNLGLWGTAGNILGTFLTGFVLLAAFGVRTIIMTSVAVLAATGVGMLILARLWLQSSEDSPERIEKAERPKKSEKGKSVLEPRTGWWQFVPNTFVFTSGMSIMMVELVGSRLVARATGSSIYTWTSLIGVVLAGVSIGNYIGGKLADRFDPSRLLPHLFLAASILAASLLKTDVLLASPSAGSKLVEWIQKIGKDKDNSSIDDSRHPSWTMPTAVFSSVFMVLFTPCFALGTISPVAAKLALERAQKAGSAIGNVYAWGAVGSIVGTFLTGFLLISLLGTKAVICAVAGLLAIVSVCMSTSGLAHSIWAGVLMALAIAVISPDKWQWATRMGDMLKVREQIPEGEFHFESNYYHIKVQPSGEHSGAMELVLDNLIHGYVLDGRPRELRYDYELIYASIMERAGAIPVAEDPSVAAAMGSKPRSLRTLFFGGGSYTYPRYIEASYPGSSMLVAEIDPAVTRTVQKVLFLDENSPVETRWGDARATVDQMLASGTEPFDFIFGDAFNDFSVPWHLTTFEFNEKVKRLLASDGVYMINIIDNYKYSKFLGSYVRTAQKTFPGVAVFCTASGGQPSESRETFVIAMSPKPIDYSDLGTRRGERFFEGSLLTQEHLEQAISRSGEIVLTDDFAPIENLLAPVARER